MLAVSWHRLVGLFLAVVALFAVCAVYVLQSERRILFANFGSAHQHLSNKADVVYISDPEFIQQFNSLKTETLKLSQQLQEIQHRIESVTSSQRSQSQRLESLACKTTKIGSRGGFCYNTDDAIAVGGNQVWDLGMTLAMEELFNGKTVGDFGAGLGWYGHFMLRLNVPVFNYGKNVEKDNFLGIPEVMAALKSPQKIKAYEGYDGAGNVQEVTGGLVKFLDLSELQHLPHRFDWILSLEVGEHIPKEYESNFVHNLAYHSCEGIILSWAVEGQDGHHHVNTRNNDYVKKVFKDIGFYSDSQWENILRNKATVSWFKNTVMVFRRNSPIMNCSSLNS